MDALSDTLYYALQGLETQLAMQHNRCIGLPCRQIVRTGVEVAQIMLGDEDVEEHKQTYYNLLSRRLYDRRDTTMAVIVMAALFSLIRNDRQAALCRNTLTADWCDEIYDVYHSYRSAVDKQIDCELTAQHSLSFTISVMKTDQPQAVVYNYGTYNDIHDNPHATIYATAPQDVPTKHAATVEPEDAPQAEYFCRITEAAISAGKAQQIDNELRSAAVSAPKLIKAIRTNEALGYLDTKNLSSTELYNLLNEHYDLPFKYRQFAQERNK
ncbi:MAG: hypothetical protein IKO63_08865 [Paludibacteraceae bacterium]|nr:hypothetical protein [Paludibacteraceae bacterium]